MQLGMTVFPTTGRRHTSKLLATSQLANDLLHLAFQVREVFVIVQHVIGNSCALLVTCLLSNACTRIVRVQTPKLHEPLHAQLRISDHDDNRVTLGVETCFHQERHVHDNGVILRVRLVDKTERAFPNRRVRNGIESLGIVRCSKRSFGEQ